VHLLIVVVEGLIEVQEPGERQDGRIWFDEAWIFELCVCVALGSEKFE